MAGGAMMERQVMRWMARFHGGIALTSLCVDDAEVIPVPQSVDAPERRQAVALFRSEAQRLVEALERLTLELVLAGFQTSDAPQGPAQHARPAPPE